MELKDRSLNFLQNNYLTLEENEKLQFARKHALSLYNKNAIYTFIPKNACTTLRASLAIANGILRKETLHENLNWIHQNSYAFSASLPDLEQASYTFTILRCPYERIVSLFLDKFVHKTKVAVHFDSISNNTFDLDKLTFNQFINHLYTNKNILNKNIHWRPQTDFLAYQTYDDYFHFSDFNYIESTLKEKIGLEIIDTRTITNHGHDTYTSINNHKDYSDTSAHEIMRLKDSGYCPLSKQILTRFNKEIIKDVYKTDFDLLASI